MKMEVYGFKAKGRLAHRGGIRGGSSVIAGRRIIGFKYNVESCVGVSIRNQATLRMIVNSRASVTGMTCYTRETGLGDRHRSRPD